MKNQEKQKAPIFGGLSMERETRVELATFTLAT